MGKSFVTPIGRVSFPSLDKLNTYGKYALTLLLPKSDPKVQEFVGILGATVKEEAKAIAGDAGYAAAMAEFKAFHDGDNKAAFKTWRNEYAGHWVLTLGRKADFGKPCVVNRDRQPIDASEVYAGCNALVFMDVFGYKFGAKKSVTFGFQHVMKTGENTRFASSGVAADKAFENLDIPEDEGPEIGADPFGPAKTPDAVIPAGNKPPLVKDPFGGM